MKIQGVEPKPPPAPTIRKIRDGGAPSPRVQIFVKGVAGVIGLAAFGIAAVNVSSAYVRVLWEAAVSGWSIWGLW